MLADYGFRVLIPHQWTTPNEGETRGSTAAGLSRSVLVCIGAAGEVTSAQRRELEDLKSARLKAGAARFRIIPVLLPGSTPDSVPEDLRTSTALDIRNGVSVDVLRPIVDALRAG